MTAQTKAHPGGAIVSLRALSTRYPALPRLPRSILVLVEAALRGHQQGRLGPEHAERLAGWQPTAPRDKEVSFLVNRILVPDSTGIPLLADLAAMRSAAARRGADPAMIEPGIQVDLVIDHSVQIDSYGHPGALARNTELEFQRNEERFRFIKWASGAFSKLKVVPPGTGICHQINLEQLSQVVCETDGYLHPDLMLGCDSHTTMVNGLGVLGWGVGGIEAEAAMLGQPTTMLLPDVIGVALRGRLPAGATTTDLALVVTERLRRAGVVGKFVEFFGDGAAGLSVPERATLSNMAPEYGATVGYFPVDERTLDYLRETGRDAAHIARARDYLIAQGLFGTPDRGEIDFTEVIDIDLAQVEASVAGPRRPQDRIALRAVKDRFADLLAAPGAEGGYGRSPGEAGDTRTRDGDVVLAAITSCTNTSNPQVMVAAGLLARNARRRGLTVDPKIKTSFSPGSRAVSSYLEKMGLLEPLAELGFDVAAYGCGTCLGNSGPLDAAIEADLAAHGTIAAAVLSGNRNFEARVHPAIRANFLASPPLVVAYALAGRMGVDFGTEPLAGDVMLAEIWPDPGETAALAASALGLGAEAAAGDGGGTQWAAIPAARTQVYDWPPSSYIKEPPFLAAGGVGTASILGARPLVVLGDSVTTDHISPAGAIKPSSDAGRWLIGAGVEPRDFNSFAARRGNHEVMVRGTFGNVRLRNLMVPGREGSLTRHHLSGDEMSIYAASRRYIDEAVPVVVIAGREYGTGSSRDWAAKGPQLLGVRAVLADSFERIHRGNLVGLGILPIEWAGGHTSAQLGFSGSEVIDIHLPGSLEPLAEVAVVVTRDGVVRRVPAILRVDTAIELDYLRSGNVMRYVLDRTI